MRRGPQPTSGVGPDQPNPGREGITRSKAIPGSRPWRRGSLSGPITSRYSATEPGQPWLSTSGSGSGSGERTCKKCTLVPSMIVVNCGWSLIRLFHARQSYRSRQCAASCWTNASETPYPWSPPRGSGAHRALSSRSRRSASSLSGTPTRNGRSSSPLDSHARLLFTGCPSREDAAADRRPLLADRVSTPGLRARAQPSEAVWSNLKRSLANLTKQGLDQLTALIKTRLKRMQYRPGLIDGFIAKTGLDLTLS